MRDRVSFAIAVALALVVAGCPSAPGTLVARQAPSQLPLVGTAPQDGAYGLFIGGETDPLFSYELRQGDKLGFDQASGTTVGNLEIHWLYAVYGQQRFRLDAAKTYEWRWLDTLASKRR